MRQVLVDTDCGVDDALAIGLVARHPGVNLVAVTSTWGNCTADEAAANAEYVLRVADSRHVPVVAGRQPDDSWQRGEAHGLDGLGGTEPPRPRWAGPTGAAQAVVEFARTHADCAEILCIGPLTNLAAALDLEPDLPHLLRRVVVMAGHGRSDDDWLRGVGDTNTGHNPRATQVVADSALPVTWVGMDVTRPVLLADNDFDDSAFGRVLRRVHHSYGVRRGDLFGYDARIRWKVPAHDGVAAACLVDAAGAGLCTVSGRMSVTAGERGPVLRAVGPGPHQIATDVDPAAVRALLGSATR
ncbi:purine nucleosidase [Rhodococcus sp. 27YEA15]|uniref:nucleoside hydrolase n=1 Tax=Rhodococcus sp. 27YEA15 TaxID=3156259 RepID=UPI003C7E3E5C